MIDFRDDVMPLKNKFYRLALRIVKEHTEAQDITQEVLIRLWQKAESLNTPSEAEALGATIAYNLSLDALKRAGRQNEPLDSDSAHLAIDNRLSPFESLSASEQREMVRNKISQLPVLWRTAIQLRDIEGKSYKEISGITGRSEEQVKITIFRARQALKAACQNTEKYGL